MALRRFRGAATSSTVVFTGQAFNRELLDTGSANGSNGSSVVLAAGASASFYLISATSVPNLTTSLIGSWESAINFQAVTPTNVFCKFRVHRISVSGTTPTILASTAYSAEVQARATNTAYIANTDGTNLGTFSSTDRIAIEWTLRNAGASSITPQPSFGTYASFVRTPIESSAAVGWTGTLGRAAYRPISYSEGTINGVKRTGRVRNTITSSGTATGTQGGVNFNGSVSGVSTSTGTIAAGRQGYKGSITGTSASSGTIAAGRQGYAGNIIGASTSTGIVAGQQGYSGLIFGSSNSIGTIATGIVGCDGAANGQSVSNGSATGTKNNEVSGGGLYQLEYLPFEPKEKTNHFFGNLKDRANYSIGISRGAANQSGKVNNYFLITSKLYGYKNSYGKTNNLIISKNVAVGKKIENRFIQAQNNSLLELVLMGEIL